MATKALLGGLPKHKLVFNQSKPLVNYNLYESDHVLKGIVKRANAKWAVDHISKVGAIAGSEDLDIKAVQANRNPPVLVKNDRYGSHVDVLDFHPSYHSIMKTNIENQVHSFGWNNQDKQSPHVARCALGFMMNQAESGTQCPITMTFACVPPLSRYMTTEQKSTCNWIEKAIYPEYDPRNIPATEKKGVTLGMSMTERQGGSDVRSNTTVATPVDANRTGSGSGYLLNGHKWFTSAPMCDAFLTLAQTKSGLSFFIVPRWIPSTGERNRGFVVVRLKEKLGDRSNASSEVTYDNAYGELLGEEGRGVPTIIEMVQHTRLDCTIGSAGLIRRSVAESINHCLSRSAFGLLLSEAPLMQNVLADLAVESEAATLTAFRIASSFDNKNDAEFSRIATAVAKYIVCKRAPGVVYEAMECHGGNGYVDEGPMPRLFRQSPLNAIWEGSGNVICLDVMRALQKTPNVIDAFMADILLARGVNSQFDLFLDQLPKDFKNFSSNQSSLRIFVSRLATALQGSLVARFGHPAVAEAFFASRLSGNNGREYGTLPPNIDFASIIKHAAPIAPTVNQK